MYKKKWGELAKACAVCGTEFVLKSGSHKYCSIACKRKYAREEGAESTNRQYALINGHWDKFLGRLLARSFRRSTLTKQDCLDLLEQQNYCCALTGVQMTCVLEKGVVRKTNVSIDRIDPKGPYTKENVQLVCAAVNKFRIDTPLDEFIDWCRKVTEHAIQKQSR